MKDTAETPQESENSEHWRREYIKACRETGTIHCDSASGRLSGEPMTFKARAEMLRGSAHFVSALARKPESQDA